MTQFKICELDLKLKTKEKQLKTESHLAFDDRSRYFKKIVAFLVKPQNIFIQYQEVSLRV